MFKFHGQKSLGRHKPLAHPHLTQLWLFVWQVDQENKNNRTFGDDIILIVKSNQLTGNSCCSLASLLTLQPFTEVHSFFLFAFWTRQRLFLAKLFQEWGG